MVASVSVISHLIFILHCLLITPLWLTVPERKYCGCYFYSTGKIVRGVNCIIMI